MTSREVRIVNRLGLHARAAARFVHIANRFRARVTVTLMSAETTSTRTSMTVLAIRVASWPGCTMAGALRACRAIATVTAVELTSPPTNPVRPAPRRHA